MAQKSIQKKKKKNLCVVLMEMFRFKPFCRLY